MIFKCKYHVTYHTDFHKKKFHNVKQQKPISIDSIFEQVDRMTFVSPSIDYNSTSLHFGLIRYVLD